MCAEVVNHKNHVMVLMMFADDYWPSLSSHSCMSHAQYKTCLDSFLVYLLAVVCLSCTVNNLPSLSSHSCMSLMHSI